MVTDAKIHLEASPVKGSKIGNERSNSSGLLSTGKKTKPFYCKIQIKG